MNLRFPLATLALAALVLTTACEGGEVTAGDYPRDTGAGPGQPITTDATSYQLRSEWAGLSATIEIRFQNRSERTMYIVNCNGGLVPELQKRVGGAWSSYFWSPMVEDCLSPPITVAPAGTLTRTIHAWGSMPGTNHYPQWASTDVAGTYRMVLHNVVWNYTDSGPVFGEPVPIEMRISNEFTLRR